MTSGVNLKQCLEDGFLSDLKLISAERKEFNVHKIVLCAQSPFFRAACTVNMKEKHEGIIKLPETTTVIQSLLDFCYTGSYELEDKSSASIGRSAMHHAMVFAMADKYQMPALQTIAEEMMRQDLIACFRPSSDGGGKFVTRFVNGLGQTRPSEDVKPLFDAISFTYHKTFAIGGLDGRTVTNALHDIFMDIPWAIDFLEDHKELFMELLSNTPKYAMDLVQSLNTCIRRFARYYEKVYTYMCANCGKTFKLDHQLHYDPMTPAGHCFHCGKRFSNWDNLKKKDGSRPRRGW